MAGGLETEWEEPSAASTSGEGVIFVLESAQLEVAKVGKNYELLNCDDHANFLRRHGKDPALYRPDICHQALLAILDSPLNKAGRLKALYVHTGKNVLIQVNPQDWVMRPELSGKPLVFVVGAFAHGKIDDSYVDEYISISQFPLSAAYALGRITNALERKWGIV
ncbi:hypothetical protein COHA_009447 [Chlorella ohadii]|uniref:Uncharacterized protein n=1 Tax=Chlorella ohadii TaxID=2649997 RepID=A0AAD5DI84_9CHLO|nr:hypothetical protein COHA_009447 [Chlorella ohadii]